MVAAAVPGGVALPADLSSLARGVPDSAPGTIFVRGQGGGIAAAPGERAAIRFGRDHSDVHVCVGGDDRRVSRRHGEFRFRDGRWWVHNTGKVPIRLPGSRLLFPSRGSVSIGAGYTPMFLRGTGGREHLIEVRVTEPREVRPPRGWRLDERERLALTVLGQRYLLHEAYPRPLPWRIAAVQLAWLQPAADWSPRAVEHLVAVVAARLARAGVLGLTGDGLLRELIGSTTLVPPDLALLERADHGPATGRTWA